MTNIKPKNLIHPILVKKSYLYRGIQPRIRIKIIKQIVILTADLSVGFNTRFISNIIKKLLESEI